MGVSADMCQCDVELPCKSCPKGNMQGKHTSAWFQLGCKRGELKDEMSKIRLCPQSQEKIVIDEYAAEVFNKSMKIRATLVKGGSEISPKR
jgi:hypothetical protein